MSDKQDKVAPRTACDIIRKYNFGKTFAETMGLAKTAKSTADKAVDTSTKSVQELDAKLDHNEVFNRLTKNGALQGLYRGEDGELYVNASFLKSGIIDAAVVQVVNLIAEKLKSTKDSQILDIDGAGIDLSVGDDVIASLNTDEFSRAFLWVRKQPGYSQPDAEYNANLSGDGLTIDFAKTDGSIGLARFGIDENGVSYAVVNRINGKNISWKDNGDGTFALIGK